MITCEKNVVFFIKLKICWKNINQSLSFQGGTTYRGCLSVNLIDSCDGNNKCVLCKSNECNGHSIDLNLILKLRMEHFLEKKRNDRPRILLDRNANIQFIENVLSCHFNNTNADLDTLEALNENGTKTCKHSDDKCFTLITEMGIVIKDCLQEYAERKNISNDFLEMFNPKTYQICSSSLCNDDDIRPMRCISCNSKNDSIRCLFSFLADRKRCPLEIQPSGCYHQQSSDYIERGCLAELDNQKRTSCELNSDECKQCSNNECNSRLIFQTCTSSNSNVVNKKDSKICRQYLDKCFIYVMNETVHRGCISDLYDTPTVGIDLPLKCQDENNCETCDVGNDCNSRDVIEDRCIKCSSIENGYCVDFPNRLNATNCSVALKQQGCYLMQFGKIKAERGCMSHLNQNDRINCGQGNGTCKMCVGDKCNVKATFQKCFVCDSENDGHECLREPLKEKTCNDYVGHCYSKAFGGVFRRGCIGDDAVQTIQECVKNPNNCKSCSDERPCNNETVKPITCISCNSTIDTTCATNGTFDKFVKCPISSIDSEKCYHFINETSREHIRGR